MAGRVPTGRGGRSLVERAIPALDRAPARWRSVLRSVGRSRRRSLSTIGGVVLALTMIVVSWAMVDTVVVLLDRQFNEIGRQDAQVWFDGPRDRAAIAELAGADGVAAAEPALELGVTIIGPGGRYSTTLVGLETSTTMHGFRAPGGGVLELPAEGLLLGSALRARLAVEAGDTVTLAVGTGSPAAAAVAGFVAEPLGTFAYASLAQATSLAGGNGAAPTASSALVRFDEGTDRAAARLVLVARPGVVAYADSRALYDMAQQYLGLFYAFIGVMIVLGGVMALAIIYITMSANVAERSGELAALRTLGMPRRTIARLVAAENLLLVAIGIVPGLVVGVILAAEFMASVTSDMFVFDLELRPSTLVLSALAVLAVGLLSQWPALRAVDSIDLGKIVRERSF
jgi:putative ABC transport system permease protein